MATAVPQTHMPTATPIAEGSTAPIPAEPLPAAASSAVSFLNTLLTHFDQYNNKLVHHSYVTPSILKEGYTFVRISAHLLFVCMISYLMTSGKMGRIRLTPSVVKSAFRERRKVLYFSALLLAINQNYTDSVEQHVTKRQFERVSDELWDYMYHTKDWRLGRMSVPLRARTRTKEQNSHVHVHVGTCRYKTLKVLYHPNPFCII